MLSDFVELPSRHGEFKIQVYSTARKREVVVVSKPWGASGFPILRIHSSCLFSESFHTTDCDCSLQLEESLELIGREGGVVLYLHDEGRGVGLMGKVAAISLQQRKGLNTREAFEELGYPADPRDFIDEIETLEAISFPKKVRLLSRNPAKSSALIQAGFEVVEFIPFKRKLNQSQVNYVKDKAKCLGHDEGDL